MAVAKNPPDKLTRVTTKRDGEPGVVIVAEGTPLARLQAIHEDPDTGVLAGDLNDVLAHCNQKDKVVAELSELAGKQKKGERVAVLTTQVQHLTNLLVNNHKRAQAALAV